MSKPKKLSAADRLKSLLTDGQDLYEELDKESHRGCVLMAGAFIEEALEHAIRNLLRQHSTFGGLPELSPSGLDELLSDFNAPIGTFAARIRLGRAIGLYSDAYCSALLLIKELRNSFAHRDVKGVRPVLDVDRVTRIIELTGAWTIMGAAIWKGKPGMHTVRGTIAAEVADWGTEPLKFWFALGAVTMINQISNVADGKYGGAIRATPFPGPMLGLASDEPHGEDIGGQP